MLKHIAFTIFISLFSTLFAAEAITIKVGSENAYKPFAYLDSNNNATGFDNDVVKLLASYMPEVKLEIVSLPWNAIFVGLDSKKFDVVANQIAKTPQRETKYIFSSKPYFYGVSGLILGKDSKIKDIKELQNVKIGVSVGSNHASNLEKYVKENPSQNIQIAYYKTSPSLLADLANARIAAMINDPVSAQEHAQAQGITLTFSDFYFEKVPVYLIFRKDSKKIADMFDIALEKAINDGKISELSIKYFGIDQSK